MQRLLDQEAAEDEVLDFATRILVAMRGWGERAGNNVVLHTKHHRTKTPVGTPTLHTEPCPSATTNVGVLPRVTAPVPTMQVMLASANSPGIKIPRNTLERIYGNSRIASRYFAVPDAAPHLSAPGDAPFYPADGSYEVQRSWWLLLRMTAVACWRLWAVRLFLRHLLACFHPPPQVL